jgi:hypothetical protein
MTYQNHQNGDSSQKIEMGIPLAANLKIVKTHSVLTITMFFRTHSCQPDVAFNIGLSEPQRKYTVI